LSGTQCLDGTSGSTGDLSSPYESKYNYKGLNTLWDFDKNDVNLRASASGASGTSLKYNFFVDIIPKDSAFLKVDIKEFK
jgi:hypothetical protein